MTLIAVAVFAMAMMRSAGAGAAPPFTLTSMIHIDPAPGSESRGFHFVVTSGVPLAECESSETQNTSIASRRVAWAAAIRGELVAVDIAGPGEPTVLYNKQEPGPTTQLYQSRTIKWLPGNEGSASGLCDGGNDGARSATETATPTRGLFVVSNRAMELINATTPTNPSTVAVVNFTGGRVESGDNDGLALNGLAILNQRAAKPGASSYIVVGAAMGGALSAAVVDVGGGGLGPPVSMSEFGTWTGPLVSAYDIDLYNSSDFGRLLVVVSPHGGTLLSVVSVTSASDRGTVLPTSQWAVHSTVPNPSGWPANTGCNRVRVHPAGNAFVSCFADALNSVMVIDLTLSQPKIIQTFPFVDEQPTGMLLVNNAVLFVAGGRDLMAFDVTKPHNTTVLASCGAPCGKIMTTSGQNAHSLDHFYDATKSAHFLALTAQIDNNLGVVEIVDPFIVSLLDRREQPSARMAL
jgi:hypothetical protein